MELDYFEDTHYLNFFWGKKKWNSPLPTHASELQLLWAPLLPVLYPVVFFCRNYSSFPSTIFSCKYYFTMFWRRHFGIQCGERALLSGWWTRPSNIIWSIFHSAFLVLFREIRVGGLTQWALVLLQYRLLPFRPCYVPKSKIPSLPLCLLACE